MADLAQLETALRNADAAGDTEAAKALAQAIIQARQKPEPSMAEKAGGALRDLGAGAIRGAGSIGATLLTPLDAAARAVGIENSVIGRRDRREAMDAGLRELGADTDSLAFKGGKLGAEIAGTAGVGGGLANGTRLGLAMTGRSVPAAAEPLLSAIASGGFSTGSKAAPGALSFLKDQAVRATGGAISGGAAAGIVNPEDADTGAMIGALTPGAIKLAGEAGNLIGRGVSGATKNVLGMTTGAGAETIGQAFQAGKAGNKTFVDNMRGNVPMTDVLDSAKEALSKMRLERGNQYRSGMIDVSADKSVINFAPIEKAVNSLQQMGSYKGQVINKNAAGTVDEISSLVNQWKGLNPAEYHTPEGLDALKKAIGDIRDATQFGSPGRKAADTAYNAVKAQIDMQAPTYSKVMKDYSQASETISEIERALSLGNKAAADTSMRKLQSLMRNNVNTNYGNRLDMARKLEDAGADILPAVAGQAASSITPRGLQALGATGAGIMGLTNPATLAMLPLSSPRLMGEAAYGLGALTRGAGNVAGAVGGAGSRALGISPRGLLDMDELAPLISTGAVISSIQR